MPEFIVTDPQGREHVVNAPEGATQEQIFAYVQQQFSSKAPDTSKAQAGIVPSLMHGVRRLGQDVGLAGLGVTGTDEEMRKQHELNQRKEEER